jgi:endonuclease III-like uncharacterized protein
MSPKSLRDMDNEELAHLIRPSVYFNAKGQKLKAFVHHLWEHYPATWKLSWTEVLKSCAESCYPSMA